MASTEQIDALRGPFDELAATLRTRASGRQLVFLRAVGNYGDGLIQHGAELFLRDRIPDTRMRIIDTDSKRAKLQAFAAGLTDPYGRRRFFVFNGGGAWSEHYSSGLQTVERQMRVTADVLVLPTTVERMPASRRQPTIFVRDRFQSSRRLPDAPFCHDMALYLALIPRDRWFDEDRMSSVPRKKLGVFFRNDKESRGHQLSRTEGNRDISVEGTHASDIQFFLAEIGACDTVITDRLHVAIAGTLLGCQVFLVEGLTYKIRAVYESSIGPFFPNCRLVSDEQAARIVSGASV